jgi:hypothetical protein
VFEHLERAHCIKSSLIYRASPQFKNIGKLRIDPELAKFRNRAGRVVCCYDLIWARNTKSQQHLDELTYAGTQFQDAQWARRPQRLQNLDGTVKIPAMAHVLRISPRKFVELFASRDPRRWESKSAGIALNDLASRTLPKDFDVLPEVHVPHFVSLKGYECFCGLLRREAMQAPQ